MTPILLDAVVRYLESQYPLTLAESWDNVGLLVGNRATTIRRIMTCLTVTPESCREALREHADLIITHHPFPFRAIQRMTSDTNIGNMLLQLIHTGIAIYSPHTAFDSAATGINQQIAKRLGLSQIATLYPSSASSEISHRQDQNLPQGTGRIGMLPQPTPLLPLVEKTAKLFDLNIASYAAPDEFLIESNERRLAQRVAIGCGAAGDFLEQAIVQKADVFLVGEVKFHTMLEARENQIALIIPGHYATERFAVERLADELQLYFADSLAVWASRCESDPLQYHCIDNS
ncbi:MAG: Nif3-like dinuclear metal center hexameric protein [Planctomycetaceae bacterium]|jgi:dinuclear metal center YbgI/SA1388 family protein|nr:Nif3-like dinuclear metal center hexameric protein [Planctomycetaceae bacterium]